MAGYQFSGNKNRATTPTATASTTATKPVSKALFRTGLFHVGDDNKEMAAKVGEIAAVKVKEDITIPAGSYLSLRQPKDGSSEKIAFNLVVNPGRAATK